MTVIWIITEECCKIINAGILFNLFYRLVVCLVVPNILIYIFYRKTEECREILILIKKVIRKIAGKMRK